jgi:CRP/FNR family transcriptional regulator
MLDHPAIAHRRPIDIASYVTARTCASCDARHIGLCDVLPDEDLRYLASVARQQRIPAGTVFIKEGDPARYFFNISQGAVKLFKSLADGRQQVTGFMGAGDFLGLAGKDAYCIAATALSEVQLCRFDRLELTAMFGRFPALERRLLDVAWHELALAQEQMLLLGRKTAIERVGSFLLGWGERVSFCAAPSVSFTLPMPRADLADYLGLTIETVSRSFTLLRRNRVIETTRQTVTITNKPRLSRYAAGSG